MYTKQHPPRFGWARLLAPLALITALMTGCGGGQQNVNTAGVGSGGTGSIGGNNSFASGPITAFGSIVVNGIHFDQTAATVTDGDDQASTPAALQLGMMVDIDAGPINSEHRAQASSIRLSSALLGKVDAINTSTNTLTVVGQTVTVSPTTYYDTNLPQGLGSIQVGDNVEIYGLNNVQRNTFVATRIERKGALSTYKISGIVQDLDFVNNTCRIGQQRIGYWQAMPPELRNGQLVRGELYATLINGQWFALSMKPLAPLTTADRDRASLSGLVTAVTPTTGLFSVNGSAVDARQVPCPLCAALKVGDKLLVRGSLVSGVLQATSVTTPSGL
jgi:hypothetical protein